MTSDDFFGFGQAPEINKGIFDAFGVVPAEVFGVPEDSMAEQGRKPELDVLAIGSEIKCRLRAFFDFGVHGVTKALFGAVGGYGMMVRPADMNADGMVRERLDIGIGYLPDRGDGQERLQFAFGPIEAVAAGNEYRVVFSQACKIKIPAEEASHPALKDNTAVFPAITEVVTKKGQFLQPRGGRRRGQADIGDLEFRRGFKKRIETAI